MVYRGRPSTGCKKCRERKIKCDERPGGCVKCAERRLECPGYDRNIDAFFQDETAHVQAKAKKSKAKAIAARDARDAREIQKYRNPEEAYFQINTQAGPGGYISESIIDQGVAFFMSQYAIGIDQPSIQSKEYSKHLATYGFHPLVATSMTALGIAGVANIYMDPRLKREATRWYLNAIKMANAAISSPKEVKADSTLVSVNLLGMYEATANDTSLSGWSDHVDGAASLIKIRGMDQFSTPAGQRTYLHTVGLLAMNCMGHGVPIPQYVHDLNTEVIKHVDTKDPRNRFFFLHIKAIDLRARILSREMTSLPEMIDAALELDEIAINIFKDQTRDWDYDVVLCEKRPGIFEHFYHVYHTAVAAQTWNWVRYNRIYFHDIIRNAILTGLGSTPPTLVGARYHEQLEVSVRTLYHLQSDILASMPQFLHEVPNSVPNSPPDDTSDNRIPTPPPEARSAPSTSPSSGPPLGRKHPLKTLDQNFKGTSFGVVRALNGTGSVKDRLPILRVAGGYSTVWAVYVAGAMPIATLESQEFVLRCLKSIETDFGIAQAKVLGGALRYKQRLAREGALPFRICPQYLPEDRHEQPVVRASYENGCVRVNLRETESLSSPPYGTPDSASQGSTDAFQNI